MRIIGNAYTKETHGSLVFTYVIGNSDDPIVATWTEADPPQVNFVNITFCNAFVAESSSFMLPILSLIDEVL